LIDQPARFGQVSQLRLHALRLELLFRRDNPPVEVAQDGVEPLPGSPAVERRVGRSQLRLTGAGSFQLGRQGSFALQPLALNHLPGVRRWLRRSGPGEIHGVPGNRGFLALFERPGPAKLF
jgi:hypothetical protein